MLRDLIERASGLLQQKAPEKATDAVKSSRFEDRLVSELREEAPALDKLATDLARNVNYAEELVKDTVLSFWQGTPELRSATEMKDTHLANHAVATDVERAEDLQQLRRHTKYDKYGSAMAAISVSEKVREWAEKHGEELKEQQERAEQARQDQEDAQEGLSEALSGAEAFQDPDYHGPPSPQQEEALAQALAAAEQAQAAQEQATQALQEKAQHAQQLLSTPIAQAVEAAEQKLDQEAKAFAGWGVDPGELKEMPFEERAQLARSLTNNRLGKYLDLVGRFKLMEAAQQVRKVEYGRDEVVGVELTGDLRDIIMSEYMALAMEDDELGEMLELDFYRRWQERQLIGRRFEGTERVGKGAIVACVDTSGSMDDYDSAGISREAWSKAFALALLDQAKRQRRDFVAINFSSRSQVSVYRFPGGKTDLLQAMQFVQQFNERGKAKADIVFITDDECSVSTAWMRNYQEKKRKLSFRTFGVAVGSRSYGRTLEALSDNVRAVSDFVDPDEVSDIFRVL